MGLEHSRLERGRDVDADAAPAGEPTDARRWPARPPGAPRAVATAGGCEVGFNHNARRGDQVVHVQTEDAGPRRAHVTTHLFVAGGRIAATKRTSYAELLGGAGLRERVRELMRRQHRAMLAEVYRGEHDASLPAPPAAVSPPPSSGVVPTASAAGRAARADDRATAPAPPAGLDGGAPPGSSEGAAAVAALGRVDGRREAGLVRAVDDPERASTAEALLALARLVAPSSDDGLDEAIALAPDGYHVLAALPGRPERALYVSCAWRGSNLALARQALRDAAHRLERGRLR
jgi:hypothetical protein